MKKGFLSLASIGAMAFLTGCNQLESVSEQGPGNQASSKPPHEFDESSILYPNIPSASMESGNPLSKRSATYYTYTIGNGLSSSDYQNIYGINHGSSAGCGPGFSSPSMTCGGNSFFEATYSSRFSAYPEDLWFPVEIYQTIRGVPTPTGLYALQTADLGDNEQAEMHFYWNMTASNADYRVSVDYVVSSEYNYDWLWINSTASDGVCNSPGVVRKKVSGATQSGNVDFVIPKGCGTGWLGIYYIKDGSLSHYGDYGKITAVRIYQNSPVNSGN